MDNHIKKVYVPMTETGFYILLCLREEAHGYSIVKKTEQLTNGEIKISPGTLYGSLSKMEKDGLIKFIREEENRKIYCITELGTQVLDLEMRRIERLYKSMEEAKFVPPLTASECTNSQAEKGAWAST
ncbi:MAG: PadR family transcriptional regulator [Lachnospiraceae bacterium]|nr:PadR family transcriptional regulator [Lachnospiraceae bacterium]